MQAILLGISSILMIITGYLGSQLLGKKLDERKNKKLTEEKNDENK